MEKNNCCTQNEEELTTAIRLAIQDRAVWFYLLYKGMKEAGCNADEVAEKAIFKFGQMKGQKIGTASTPKEFFDGIATKNAALAFAMEPREVEAEKGIYRFHHCALVEAWKKLGCSPEEVKHLCDLASCGDQGVVSCFPELELKFNSLIAAGDAYCELEITKKK
ncbi:L-2-amino-thiazoline-4-carboxylic acid hydrolase [Sporomusa aerivorans]|uniref:L-2-amino-thiazoline-4-carboxylic acid hydrolase n=1 Tax=Sporomusa aerivorans TaxID=204936 RepID=UPI003529FD3C